MVIWSGLGILALVFAVLGAIGGAGLVNSTGGLGLGLPEDVGIALGLGVAAVVNWFVGVGLNRRAGRELIDAQTGERVVLRRRHRLFWVPMQYWSVVMAVFAVLIVTTRQAPQRPDPVTLPPASPSSNGRQPG